CRSRIAWRRTFYTRLRRDGMKLQRVAREIERRNGLLRRAVQRAGVDQTGSADPAVVADVRVALQQVVVRLLVDQALLESKIVAVDDGDEFAVQFEAGEVPVARHVDAGRVVGEL